MPKNSLLKGLRIISIMSETTDKPVFDISFQMSVLNMALKDEKLASKLVKHLEDPDVREYQVFDNIALQWIYRKIVQSFEKFKTRPSITQLKQELIMLAPDEQVDYSAMLEKVLQHDLHDDKYVRKHLQGFLREIKVASGFLNVKKIWNDRRSGIEDKNIDSTETMQKIVDNIRRVDFDEEDVVTFDDLPDLLNESINSSKGAIPTGIPSLDSDLLGGLPREGLCVVLGTTNVGKSMFCLNLGAEALKRGHKLLYVNLEGRRDQAPIRLMSILSGIPYMRLIKKEFNEGELARFEQTRSIYNKNNLKIQNMLGYGTTIEDLAATVREIRKDFKFDMMVVDYGQLLGTKDKMEGHRFTQSQVFRGLDALAKELRCVVISPAQGTRNAQKDQNENRRKKDDNSPTRVLRAEDISEAFEIARLAEVILTLNRTDEEKAGNRMRVYLEKQRTGVTGRTYGLITNFDCCRVITDKFYDPGAVGENLSEQMEREMSTVVVSGTSEKPGVLPVDKMIIEHDKLAFRIRELREKANQLSPDSPGAELAAEAIKFEYSNLKKELNGVRDRITFDVEKMYPRASMDLIKIAGESLKDLEKHSLVPPSQLEAQRLEVRRLEFLRSKFMN